MGNICCVQVEADSDDEGLPADTIVPEPPSVQTNNGKCEDPFPRGTWGAIACGNRQVVKAETQVPYGPLHANDDQSHNGQVHYELSSLAQDMIRIFAAQDNQIFFSVPAGQPVLHLTEAGCMLLQDMAKPSHQTKQSKVPFPLGLKHDDMALSNKQSESDTHSSLEVVPLGFWSSFNVFSRAVKAETQSYHLPLVVDHRCQGQAVYQLSSVAQEILASFACQDRQTFFSVPAGQPKISLTEAGHMLLQDLAQPSHQNEQRVLSLTLEAPGSSRLFENFCQTRQYGEPEPEFSLSDQRERIWIQDDFLSGNELPLQGTSWSGNHHYGLMHFGNIQNGEDMFYTLTVVNGRETSLWMSHVVVCNIYNLQGLVTVSKATKEVAGIRLLDGVVDLLKCFVCEERSDYSYLPHAKVVDVTVDYEGFDQIGEETVTHQWSDVWQVLQGVHDPTPTGSPFEPLSGPPGPYGEAFFPPPFHPPPQPPSPPPGCGSPSSSGLFPHRAHNSTPQEESTEDTVGVEVPKLQAYYTYKGTEHFSEKVVAVRRAFEELTPFSLNYIVHAGRTLLGGLAQLNRQDVREVHRAYDRLVNYLTNPDNRQGLQEEMAEAGIHHVGLLDVLFELVLLTILQETSSNPRPGGFLQHLFVLLMAIRPPEVNWTLEGQCFFNFIQDQIMTVLDLVFALGDDVFQSPGRLAGELQNAIEMQVDFMLSRLD